MKKIAVALLLATTTLFSSEPINHAQSQRILILDFNSQYSQLIARRVREMGVYCELHPCSMSRAAVEAFAPQGIILSGGPDSTRSMDSEILSLECPILGICYGMQLMAKQLGGTVQTQDAEFGNTQMHIANSELFHAIDTDRFTVWMSHNDQVTHLPKNFIPIAHTASCPHAAMECTKRQFYGLQFHPEVTNTQHGMQMLKNFVLSICKAKPLWQTGDIINKAITDIKKQVGNEHVLLALSGGVDSSVTAALLHRAIGDQLHCVFVDNGLVRSDEQKAIDALQHELGVRVIRVDASDQFLNKLKGVTSPEQKRKIIGGTFIEVFQEEAKKMDFPVEEMRSIIDETLGHLDQVAKNVSSNLPQSFPDEIATAIFNGMQKVVKKFEFA